MAWETYIDENGEPAVAGPDGGVIIADDEHGGGARITFERLGGEGPYGITCGVYGWMMHSRYFAAEHEAQAAFGAMKTALAAIVEIIPLNSDSQVDEKIERVSAERSAFVDRFP